MATVPTCKPLWHVKSVMIVTSDITTRPINNLVHQSAHYLEGPLNNCFASPVQFSEWSLLGFGLGQPTAFKKLVYLPSIVSWSLWILPEPKSVRETLLIN